MLSSLTIKLMMYVYFLSLFPTFEGRYALLVGINQGLSPIQSFLIATLGVITLSIAIPLLLPYIDSFFSKTNITILRDIYEKIVLRTRRKAEKYIVKYGFIGLVIFVAIPLPGTGVWTGSLATFLFGIPPKTALAALLIGGVISNIITTTMALGYSIIG